MKNDIVAEFVKSKSQTDDIGVASISDAEVEQPTIAPKPKKPYEKPAFRFEKVFVNTALSRSKLAGMWDSTNIKASVTPD
jgi:hypothetical protein